MLKIEFSKHLTTLAGQLLIKILRYNAEYYLTIKIIKITNTKYDP